METFHKCAINDFAWRFRSLIGLLELGGRKRGVYSGNRECSCYFAYSVKKT